eukprot:COSAG01_NODE_63814_length_278_cov_1.743017_1_plen_30_part_10
MPSTANDDGLRNMYVCCTCMYVLVPDLDYP